MLHVKTCVLDIQNRRVIGRVLVGVSESVIMSPIIFIFIVVSFPCPTVIPTQLQGIPRRPALYVYDLLDHRLNVGRVIIVIQHPCCRIPLNAFCSPRIRCLISVIRICGHSRAVSNRSGAKIPFYNPTRIKFASSSNQPQRSRVYRRPGGDCHLSEPHSSIRFHRTLPINNYLPCPYVSRVRRRNSD